MVFEEKLLINTVGKIMGIKTNKLDNMLVHAARYTARQFVKRVMEQFPNAEKYELKTENLLSYEQFQKVFAQDDPHVSLLFNTGSDTLPIVSSLHICWKQALEHQLKRKTPWMR